MPIELETISSQNFSEFAQKVKGFNGFLGQDVGCKVLFLREKCPDQKEAIKRCGECNIAKGDQNIMVTALKEQGFQQLYGPETSIIDSSQLVSGLQLNNQIVRLFHLDGSVSYRSESIEISK